MSERKDLALLLGELMAGIDQEACFAGNFGFAGRIQQPYLKVRDRLASLPGTTTAEAYARMIRRTVAEEVAAGLGMTLTADGARVVEQPPVARHEVEPNTDLLDRAAARVHARPSRKSLREIFGIPKEPS